MKINRRIYVLGVSKVLIKSSIKFTYTSLSPSVLVSYNWSQPRCMLSCFSFLILKVTSTASQSVVERWKKANARNAAQELVAIIISYELIISLPVKWMALDTPPSPIWLTSITLIRASFSFNFIISLYASNQRGEGLFSRATTIVVSRWNTYHFSPSHTKLHSALCPTSLFDALYITCKNNSDDYSFGMKKVSENNTV